jgi:hypothetical protein
MTKNWKKNYIWNSVFSSVTDPDPNPDLPDPHVFVPPRSGSGSDWIHQSEVWIRIRIHPKMSWIRNTGIFKHAFYLQFSQTQLSGKVIFAPSSSISESEPDVESASGPPVDRTSPSINVRTSYWCCRSRSLYIETDYELAFSKLFGSWS